MKALFAALLCFVFTTSQTFAIKGGPEYPAGTNLVGTFAGVMQGVFDPTNPSSSNSIGVFSIGVPRTGNATGPFVMFSRGRVFTGTTHATADPTKSSIKGVLDATYNFTLSRSVTDILGIAHVETTTVTATANGPLDATVSSTKTKNLGTASTILKGSAVINISHGEVSANTLAPIIVDIHSLTVSGYKQSDAAPTGTGG